MAETPRILIVSDIPEAQKRLEAAVLKTGYNVTVETHPDKISESARATDLRAAILQWRANGLAGLLIGRLTNIWAMPVLCLEPEEDTKAALRAYRADAYDVLSDKISDADLLDHLLGAVADGERLHRGGRARLGNYELAEILGRGGNGTVYAAHDLEHNLPVALKLLHADLSQNKEYIARFTREAKSAMKLDHPTLMKVYEASRARGRIFIAMERVEGRPLDILIRNDGRLDPGRALRLARQIAEGLAVAHGLGLIHRDIKPGNIIVDSSDRIKLLDFGLLKPAFEESTRITQADEFIGTLQYAAPEQLRGERVDNRCDIYSLGVVLYEMLGATRPHPGTDSTQVAFDVAAGKPSIPIQKVNSSVGQNLANLIHQMLSPVQVLRPVNARDVIARIDKLLENPWS